MTTANEIILSAYKRCGSMSPYDNMSAQDAAEGLETLNDLLDSLSTDQASVYSSSETILTFVPGQYQYTVGNYTSPNTFTGTLINGSAVISGVTIPSDLIARGDLTVNGTGLQAGSTVSIVGTNTVTMSLTANATVPTPQVFSYTVPGDFKMPRPLRVSRSFTRITTQASGLDYGIDVIDQNTYNRIGFKRIPAPWPTSMWYNPTMPLGNLYVYQTPSTAGEFHFFTDNILSNFATLNTNVLLPQGYPRALKWLLCRELCAVNRYQITPLIEKMAKDSYDFIKALNEQPVPVSTFDDILVSNRGRDYSWIMSGGFGGSN